MKTRCGSLRLLVTLLLINAGTLAMSMSLPGLNQNQEKKNARLSLSYSNHNNHSPRLQATVKTRVDRVYVGVEDVKVDFYIHEIKDENYLGSSNTNENGEVIFEIPASFHELIDTSDKYQFYASIENDPGFLDKEDAIEIKRSQIELEVDERDSIKKVTFSIVGVDEEGAFRPREDIEVGIFVKRLFGLLPLGEIEYTNEEGVVSLDIPNEIPGNSDGELIIHAVVDDDSDYGTLVGTQTIKGSIPVIVNSESKELWSTAANAPTYLVVIISSLVLLVWGTIAFSVYLIFQIKKAGSV